MKRLKKCLQVKRRGPGLGLMVQRTSQNMIKFKKERTYRIGGLMKTSRLYNALQRQLRQDLGISVTTWVLSFSQYYTILNRSNQTKQFQDQHLPLSFKVPRPYSPHDYLSNISTHPLQSRNSGTDGPRPPSPSKQVLWPSKGGKDRTGGSKRDCRSPSVPGSVNHCRIPLRFLTVPRDRDLSLPLKVQVQGEESPQRWTFVLFRSGNYFSCKTTH